MMRVVPALGLLAFAALSLFLGLLNLRVAVPQHRRRGDRGSVQYATGVGWGLILLGIGLAIAGSWVAVTDLLGS